MSKELLAPPAWKASYTSGDGRVDEKRQKALLALAKTHEMAVAGLSGGQLAALQSDALDYIDACLKFEEIWLRAEDREDAPLRIAKIERWREASRKALACGAFFEFTRSWWLDYLS